MAPATESIMGSLPLAKAGVGSAVNDTTRQVGGALGVAVIGSVLSASYSSAIGNVLAGTPVPAELVGAAQSGIGGTQQVVAALRAQPGGGGLADSLASTANQAFVTGFHHGVIVAGLVTLAGVFVAAIFLPARARSEDAAEQRDEFIAEHADDVDLDVIVAAETGDEPPPAVLRPPHGRPGADPAQPAHRPRLHRRLTAVAGNGEERDEAVRRDVGRRSRGRPRERRGGAGEPVGWRRRRGAAGPSPCRGPRRSRSTGGWDMCRVQLRCTVTSPVTVGRSMIGSCVPSRTNDGHSDSRCEPSTTRS